MDMKMPTQGVMKYPRAEVWASTPPVQRLQLQNGGGGAGPAGSHGRGGGGAHDSCPTSHHALLRFTSWPLPLCWLTKLRNPCRAPAQPFASFIPPYLSLLLSTYYVLILLHAPYSLRTEL